MKRTKAVFAVALIAIFAAASFAAKHEGEKKPFAVGDTVASLELVNLEEKTEQVELKKEGVTALAFFASSCSACRAELSLLNSLKKERKDLRVIAISVDAAGAKSTKRFMEQTKFDFDYYLDTEFAVAERFGFTFTPGLVLIKGDGEIYFSKGGFMNRDEELIVSEVLKK